ncbi:MULTISPECIES: SRPBCC domain-containing protein [unclassified Amycolatopsis]|uniref:SRPBCC family protein n=1 Tax=unclassified Amycolatopsis TaxID=2618356 RepID=UPI001FF22FF0|nr:SRPBCC domain-containing protein [Amycolatopsis sp. FBCC-B4732]UOX84874.1 SRPBCC domain-containing protein [Amycolatopsis sp. FBCC-B4732]
MPELTITRVFDAPRELVFAAWTDPDQLASWLGPHGYTGCAVTLATRPGGAWRACIRSPEGDEHWMHGTYREITAPERLVFTFTWDTEGDLRAETLVTIDFADLDGKTEMTFVQAGFPAAADRDDHHGGWTSSFDDLAGFIHHRGEEDR